MTIGIRELKANLSACLKRVRAGATIHVTDRGRTIATIQPAERAPNRAWLHQMIAEGKATWGGGKPLGASKPIRIPPGAKTLTEMLLEDRR